MNESEGIIKFDPFEKVLAKGVIVSLFYSFISYFAYCLIGSYSNIVLIESLYLIITIIIIILIMAITGRLALGEIKNGGDT